MAKQRATKTLTKAQRIQGSVIKTAWWWVGNVIFGLAPVLLVMLITSLPLNLKANSSSNHELEHLIKDGAINFFWLAIMGAIAVDIMLAKGNFKGNFPIVMLVIAMAMALFVAVVYMCFVIGGDEIHAFGELSWLRIGLGLFSFSFCTIGKISLFLKEVR